MCWVLCQPPGIRGGRKPHLALGRFKRALEAGWVSEGARQSGVRCREEGGYPGPTCSSSSIIPISLITQDNLELWPLSSQVQNAFLSPGPFHISALSILSTPHPTHQRGGRSSLLPTPNLVTCYVTPLPPPFDFGSPEYLT